MRTAIDVHALSSFIVLLLFTRKTLSPMRAARSICKVRQLTSLYRCPGKPHDPQRHSVNDRHLHQYMTCVRGNFFHAVFRVASLSHMQQCFTFHFWLFSVCMTQFVDTRNFEYAKRTRTNRKNGKRRRRQ